MAELAANVGKEILPSSLIEAAESMAGKAAGFANKTAAELGAKGPQSEAERAITGNFAITDNAGEALRQQQSTQIIEANQSLINHVTDLMPQVQNGKLDWILGGSSAVNALAGARSLTLLDAGKLPGIVSGRTIEFSDKAISSLRNFTRPIGDIDAFVVNGGENKFLSSPYVGSMDLEVPQSAEAALQATGEARFAPLIQGVEMKFATPEIAAIESAGKTVYVTAPGQLMGNKFRHVLTAYAPADADKLTGDFSRLLDVASTMYSEPELIQFGKQAIERNNIMLDGDVIVPWNPSPDNTRYLGFLRKVLESEERNGPFLRGLKVGDQDAMSTLRLLEKHPLPEDKSAIADFINKHAEFVKSIDVPGSPERTLYRSQGGTGKGSQTFLRVMDNVQAHRSVEGASSVKEQLEALEQRLSQSRDLPSLDPAGRHFKRS